MQDNSKIKKKKLKVNFDMIQADKDFYLANCNFNELQENIFKDLTGKRPLSIIQISMKENISDRTVDRNIRQIKLKMLKVIMTK